MHDRKVDRLRVLKHEIMTSIKRPEYKKTKEKVGETRLAGGSEGRAIIDIFL